METYPTTTKPTLGFIGLGVMGASMASHLQSHGYPLHIHTRTRAKAEALVAGGARWAASPGALTRECTVIITMVGLPSDVESIYFGPDGLIAQANPGTIMIDMTTSSPALAIRIEQAARARGVPCLDAPVSGGDRGAREARLSIMAGGSETTFTEALPIFQCMGSNIVHQGPAGAGQHTKMANQIAVAASMFGVVESLAYAHSAGLDPHKVLASIRSGAAGSWSMENLAPRILNGDFTPGFFVKHFIKDMTIALQSAAELNCALPCLELAKASYSRLAALGHEDAGTQALAHLYFGNHSPAQ